MFPWDARSGYGVESLPLIKTTLDLLYSSIQLPRQLLPRRLVPCHDCIFDELSVPGPRCSEVTEHLFITHPWLSSLGGNVARETAPRKSLQVLELFPDRLLFMRIDPNRVQMHVAAEFQ